MFFYIQRNTQFTGNITQKDWINVFRKRDPEVSEIRLQSIGKDRANVTKQQLIDWFDDFRTYLSNEESLDILGNPTRIHNADESSFSLATFGDF